MIFESTMKAELPKTNKFIDPALYTFAEYAKIAGHKIDSTGEDYYHRNNAYSANLATLNEYPPVEYDRHISTITIKGEVFTTRANVVDITSLDWRKYDSNEKPVMIDGVHQKLTKEEIQIALTGKEKYSYHFAIFNDDNQCVARTQAEWDCLLVMVADEYRGFGLGPYIVGIHRKYFPDADSGGFTVPGIINLEKVHTAFVKEYMASGKYSKLVRDKKLTAEKVKQITKSAVATKTKSKISFNEKPVLSKRIQIFHDHENSSEWIVYDESLVDLIDEDKLSSSYWAEKSILAAHYNEITDSKTNGTYSFIKTGRYANIKAKQHLTKIACSLDLHNGISKFRVLNKDLSDFQEMFSIIEPCDSKSTFVSFNEEYTIDYTIINGLVDREQDFRNTFDEYDEFKLKLWELGSVYID